QAAAERNLALHARDESPREAGLAGHLDRRLRRAGRSLHAEGKLDARLGGGLDLDGDEPRDRGRQRRMAVHDRMLAEEQYLARRPALPHPASPSIQDLSGSRITTGLALFSAATLRAPERRQAARSAWI